MRYKGTLVVVKNCAKALSFYKNVLGLELLQDNDGNMELSGGELIRLKAISSVRYGSYKV